MRYKFLEFFANRVLRARWIKDDEGCMGIRILGINMIYYKWPEPMIHTGSWSFAGKREFGETVKSQQYSTDPV